MPLMSFTKRFNTMLISILVLFRKKNTTVVKAVETYVVKLMFLKRQLESFWINRIKSNIHRKYISNQNELTVIRIIQFTKSGKRLVSSWFLVVFFIGTAHAWMYACKSCMHVKFASKFKLIIWTDKCNILSPAAYYVWFLFPTRFVH